jgi:hypothetical protein
MLHEMTTTLPPEEVLDRAESFFAERVPQYAAFPEKRSESYAVFRGQGGEEIAVAVFEEPQGVRIRASSLLHQQAIGRFFSTLPRKEDVT